MLDFVRRMLGFGTVPAAATSEDPRREALGHCRLFARDTTLPPDVLHKYKVGLILTDPTYCDASSKLGGFVAPHRFLIISGHGNRLSDAADHGWELCIWPRNSFFKVIDKITYEDRVQIALLEIPKACLHLFQGEEASPVEQSFAELARGSFRHFCHAPPAPELNNDTWRKRLVYPIGINDQGEYFLVALQPGTSQLFEFEIEGPPPFAAKDSVAVVDDFRRGDLIEFVRVGPNSLEMRKAASHAENTGKPKYRLAAATKPGHIRLIYVGD